MHTSFHDSEDETSANVLLYVNDVSLTSMWLQLFLTKHFNSKYGQTLIIKIKMGDLTALEIRDKTLMSGDSDIQWSKER